MRIRIISWIFIFFIIINTSACRNTYVNDNPVTLTDFYFDTVISISIYAGDTSSSYERIINNCFSKCSEYEQIISKTIKTSDTSKINSSNGKSVLVSDVEADLIKKSLYYSELTDGLFDITIEPLSSLWNFGHSAAVPDKASIEKVLPDINYKYITLKDNTITMENPNASIDLGGIAKGYVADKIKKILLSEGVTSAIINLGGNIQLIGLKPNGKDFVIGIKKPFSNDDYAARLSAGDVSVVTSGVYERYFYEGDTLYHHILNPRNGYPCSNGLYSVTIITEKSVDADALSTSCFLLGKAKGLELINSLPNTEAIFIDENLEMTFSDNLKTDSNGFVKITK